MSVELTREQQLPVHVEQIRQLETAGFEKLSTSPLFVAGGFTITVDENGRYTFFTDYDEFGSKKGKIKGLKKGSIVQFSGGQAIATVRVDDEGNEYPSEHTINGSGGMLRERDGIPVPKISDFDGRSFAKQLLDADFNAVDSEQQIFHCNLGKTDVYGIAHEDEIELIKSVDEYEWKKKRRKAVEKFGVTIIGLEEGEVPDVFGKMTSKLVLKARNSVMEFEYDKKGNVYVKKLLRDLTPEELGIESEQIPEDTGFVIGGTNTTELVKSLPSINGHPVSTLESRMQPTSRFSNQRNGGISDAGFLGWDEHLLYVLAEDNDFVINQGLSHQDLGNMIKYVEAMNRILGLSEFTYKGRSFDSKLVGWRGYQSSPFNDDTKTDSDIRVTNLSSGKSFNCSALLGEMVCRYGFYEGKGTRYRLEPQDVIDVFDFLKSE